MKQTELTFTEPTQNTDGSAIASPLSYTAFIDTVNPPVKSYAVPAANSVAVNGIVTVTFADIGFTPVSGTTYYADVTATDALGTSAPSNSATFAYDLAPKAPTGFTVA